MSWFERIERTSAAARRAERGIALVAAMLVMVLLLGIGAALHTTVIGETSLRGGHLRATMGFYAAEAGINRGMGDYRDIFLNYNIPTGSDFNPHTITVGPRNVTYQLTNLPGNPFTVVVPAGRLFAGLNATEYRYTANSSSQLTTGDTEASIGTQFNVDYIPIFQFLAFYQNDLEMLPGPTATFHGPVHTNGSLYLNSNNTMTIADCLVPTCPAAIPIVHLSAAGNVYRGRKDTSSCTGTVSIAKLVDADHNGALDQQAMACGGGGGTSQETSAQLTSWLGAILARQPVVSVPPPGVLARGSGDYWQKADLRIVLDLDSADANGRVPIVVQQADGTIDATRNALLQAFMGAKPGRVFYNDVPVAGKRNTSVSCTAPAASAYCHQGSYTPNFAAVGDVYACPGSDIGLYPSCGTYVANQALGTGGVTARRGGFYNNREHDWVYMLNLNAHDLLAWNRAQAAGNQFFDPNNNNEGGIVMFLSVKGPGYAGVNSPRYGVRVFGTPNLDFPTGMADPTGLTVVSDQAMYVEGTYNNGSGSCTFGAAGSCPKFPAAFMADTINVLSNNWSSSTACRNDCQGYQPLASRPATATTIYAAFLANVDATTAGNYNGGFENYPRFHESWAGTLTYRGSFVSLGAPSHSNGIWCGTGGSCTIGSAGCGTTANCNIYDPPTRNWDYDTDFQNVANLPPITPRFVTVQQILFTENFR